MVPQNWEPSGSETRLVHMTNDDSLQAADEGVAERARQHCGDSILLIERGLTLHMQALGFLGKNGEWGSLASTLRVTLLTRSFNSCHIAYRSLVWGYHSQALMLLRSALDDWLAERYVKVHPEETAKWSDHVLPPPKRSTRIRCLEASDRTRARKVFQQLDDFDHPGRKGVWQIMEPRPTGGYLRLGGHFDPEWVRIVSALVLFAISLLHNSLQQLMLDMELQPESSWHASAEAFDNEATKWMDQFNEAAAEKQGIKSLADDEHS